MKTVLLITNGFPPLTGGGVLRPSRLAKYLPDWGWHPIVLSMSVSTETIRFGEPGEKYAREILRPPRLDVTEWYMIGRRLLGNMRKTKGTRNTKSRQPEEASVVSATNKPRLSNYFLIPDNRVLWIPGAVVVALWTIWRRRPKAIFSMAPDPSAHLVAWVVSRLSGIRWVAEFRDPWVTNPFRHPRPFGWMESIEHRMEGRVVRDCDHICVTSVEYKDDFLRRYPDLADEKISHIPNGFDPADFEDIVPEQFTRFTIVHAGNFYGSRTATLFISAYAKLLNRRPDIKNRTQVVFVGNVDQPAIALISNDILRDHVVVLGQRTHRETLRLICGADLLLLVPGPGSGTMPGKVFEYLRASRPIYCLANEGPTAKLIEETGAGVTEARTDPASVADSLERMIDSLQNGAKGYSSSIKSIEKYNRRTIACQIAEALESTSV